MNGFFVMLKTNLKLLLRNKASVFLILIIPLVSALILKIPIHTDATEVGVFNIDVVVFDDSSDMLSSNLIDVLKSNDSFNINVQKGAANDLNAARERAVNLANKSAAVGFIYIPQNFSDSIIDGKTDNLITVFSTGTDDRVKLLKNDINIIMSRYQMYSKAANGNKVVFRHLIDSAAKMGTKHETVTITAGDRSLNDNEKKQLKNFGYLVAIMSMILIFSGNFIANIFIEEKNNRVLKRIMLTKSNIFNYIAVKGAVALISLLVQTAMIIVGIKLFVKVNVGMNLMEIAILIFGLGLIFNALSIALGAIFESLNNANYLALFIASISALLSGLYFSIDITPNWMQNISLLMPQRWLMKTANQIIIGANYWLPLFVIIVAAYIVLFLTLGYLGLKVNND